MVRSREIRDHGDPDKDIKSAPGGTAIVTDMSLKLMNVVGSCIDTDSSSLLAGMSAYFFLLTGPLNMCTTYLGGLVINNMERSHRLLLH
ncbi:hypothetical protein CDAR_111131 [Caerostris darwini]|uniref:Uncharacterized protein n=1 Tax=Caerostris darwini TaxID=1538125 RepID=A0AAV4SQH3_9ARAC|nr:hypothetical protein CDAR_111131 [Caerostris darwini]